MYLTRDLVALALGLTPRYGYRWPSAVEGRLGIAEDGWHRLAAWAKREHLEAFLIVWGGVIAYVLELDVAKVAVVGAGALLIARSWIRGAVLRASARRKAQWRPES